MDKELLNIIVKFYVSEYNEGPGIMVQRSPEWFANMVYTCGGSCMSVVMGANKYKSIEQLITDKIKLAKGEEVFIANPATIFGTMFESVAELIISKDLDNPIYGTDITINNKFKGVRYSPDGIIVSKVDEQYCICLVEIKSPLNRVPVEDKIPIEYYHQMQLGLASIPICEYGLFVDCQFRKCNLDALEQESGCNYPSPPYDIIYHKNKYGRFTTPSNEYHARGFILLATPNEKIDLHIRKGWKSEKWQPGDNALNLDVNYFYEAHTTKGYMDAGNVSPDTFDLILTLINNKQILNINSKIYSNSELLSEDVIYSDIHKIELPENYNILGFIPYKLVEFVKKIITKEDNYIDIALPKITEVINKVRDGLANCKSDE